MITLTPCAVDKYCKSVDPPAELIGICNNNREQWRTQFWCGLYPISSIVVTRSSVCIQQRITTRLLTTRKDNMCLPGYKKKYVFICQIRTLDLETPIDLFRQRAGERYSRKEVNLKSSNVKKVSQPSLRSRTSHVGNCKGEVTVFAVFRDD